MSDLFPVPIALSQLDQFKKQANILGEEIHSIIGGKVLRGNRALNLYAAACDYASYNEVTIASKGITLSPDESDTLFILQDERLPTMARNIAEYSPFIDDAQAFQALITLRNQTSLGHNRLNKAKKALAPAFSNGPYLYQDEFQSEMTPALQTLLKSGQGEVIKSTNNKLPVILVDLTQVPSQIAEVFYTIPEVIEFDFDINRKDIQYSNCRGKGHVAKGEDNWRIKVSFDTWYCEEIPMDVIQKWNIFKTWLSQFVTTEKIELTERITDRRWRHTVVQSSREAQVIIDSLSSEQDKLLYTLLITDFDKLSDIDVFSTPAADIDLNKLKSKEALNREAFYDQLGKDMNQTALTVLQDKYSLIEQGEVTAKQWCQNIMFDHSIPQQRAADFLKDEHGIEVELLPEPELFMDITDENGNSTLFHDQVNEEFPQLQDKNTYNDFVISPNKKRPTNIMTEQDIANITGVPVDLPKLTQIDIGQSQINAGMNVAESNENTLSAGEQFAGRKRGEEFNPVFSDVVGIFNACKDDFETTLGAYPLRELANGIYLRMANTAGFTSLDLAGWLIDNSRKVCIPVIFDEN